MSTSTLTQASHQWATRPADERFTSLTELLAAAHKQRENSISKAISTRQLEVLPVDGDLKGLQIVGPNGTPVTPTNWSFSQLAGLAKAPGGYLRKLPAPLVADCMNYGLRFVRDIEDVGVLVEHDPAKQERGTLVAATGPNYGRVWDETIAKALIERFGDGVTGDFKVPGEFGKAVMVTKANTTLFKGDRDMFVFLADEQNRIEIPNRRNGKSGSMARGFFVWNSQVGARTFGVAMFMFDYVCCNRIVWGAEGVTEIRVRHTVSAPDKWVEEVTPAIMAFANSSAAPAEAMLRAAQQKKVDDVQAFLENRKFTANLAKSIEAAFQADEQRPMETLFDVATGITAYARGVAWQDKRVDLEQRAGKILKLAA